MIPGPQPQDAPQQSRDLIRSLLLTDPEVERLDPYGILWKADAIAQRSAWRLDWVAAIEYWWDLARAGVVALVGGSSQSFGINRTLVVTGWGRRALEDDRVSPYEHTRYLQALHQRVRRVDPIVLAYLEEATGALTVRLHRASIVMLGAACERLIIMLAEAVRDAALVTYSDKIRDWLASDKPVPIKALYEYTRDALVNAADLPSGLADEIDLNLTPIFERARGLRNQHGHPTGAEVTREQAEAGLLLFPGFCSLVDRLVAHLRTRPATQGPKA